MTASIGIRAYQVTINKKGDRALTRFDSSELRVRVPEFVSGFVAKNAAVVQNTELERSWFFEPKDDDGQGNTKGYVQYGTYGFESNLVNNKTKEKNYRRKIDDVEEIPLFYEFWFPGVANFGLIAFQSFQGRSCISIVMAKMREAFEAVNPGYRLQYKKLLPNDVRGSLYYGAPVKRLRFIKRSAPSDITDRYLPNNSGGADFEVSLTARRRRSLGDLASIFETLNSSDGGLVVHDGIGFNEAVAEIKIGNAIRRVGVFGSNSDAGVIDLTDVIVKGPDGHPTFVSMAEQSDAILKDFHDILLGRSV
ncbi:hypothetical protein [Caulobacter sp. Root1472]|uniref:hypothetical protein n=1 Tax=Caulobacter sp. Root1472 TaxID=1736470 RepID=UPI000A9656DE|nr:hypothetical protein [Caulobacter sp. Root1472]